MNIESIKNIADSLGASPVKSITGIIGGGAAIPFVVVAFDYITQKISDIFVIINTKLIDKIPVKFIRVSLQNKQIAMLENSIKSYKETIKKLKEK